MAFDLGRIKYTWSDNSGVGGALGTDAFNARVTNLTQTLNFAKSELSTRNLELAYYENVDFTLSDKLQSVVNFEGLEGASNEQAIIHEVDTVDNITLIDSNFNDKQFTLSWSDNTGGVNNSDDILYILISNTTANTRFAFTNDVSRSSTFYKKEIVLGTVGDTIEVNIGLVSQSGLYSTLQTINTTILASVDYCAVANICLESNVCNLTK